LLATRIGVPGLPLCRSKSLRAGIGIAGWIFAATFEVIAGVAGAVAATAGALEKIHSTPVQVVALVAVQFTVRFTVAADDGPTTFEGWLNCGATAPAAGRYPETTKQFSPELLVTE
jgi:hypothetical protein